MEQLSTKKELRAHVLQELKRSCVGTAREKQSLLLRQKFYSELDKKEGTLNIAIYAPLAHEVNLLPFLTERPQHRYLFPRCLSLGHMEFYHARDLDSDFERSPKGFLEPLSSCPLTPAEMIDIILVPSVAFTKEGIRLGYGGGFYDRYLPRCPQAEVLSLCFPQQIVAHIPHQEHDIAIAKLITL